MTSADTPTFSELGLSDELCATLAELHYTTPTPIQCAAIPHLLAGEDLIGQAATGTGKTAAFSLPILERFDVDDRRPQALVVVPTRELALQVSIACNRYGAALGARAVALVGGQPIGPQTRALNRGAHIVVATPGRAIDHLDRGSLDLSAIATVVLDEADEMLDMGFADELASIFDRLPAERQTVLFSATLPPRVAAVAERHQSDPVRVEVRNADETSSAVDVKHVVYGVHRDHKLAALARVIAMEEPKAIIFCRTREEVDEVAAALNARGHRAEALHGGMDQQQRDRVLQRLRSGTVHLLVATDVAARGLDVDVLTHVINFNVPTQPESFLHRVGRVGRAGRAGTAITLAEPRQARLIENIERYLRATLPVAPLPSPAELAERRSARTIDALRAAVDARRDTPRGWGDHEQAVLDRLSDLDPHEVILAAIGLLGSTGPDGSDHEEIPSVSFRRTRPTERTGRGARTGTRPGAKGRPPERERDTGGRHRPGAGASGFGASGFGAPGAGASAGVGGREGTDTAYVRIDAGRKAGVRPADLVGAIANDVGVPGRQVGPIRISDNYSVVGVPRRELASVIRSLSSIRGKPVHTREYRP